jgi:FkbM family methyltransferase
MARLSLTPRGMRITTRLHDGVVICGKNIKGYGGRGIYVSREDIEPEFSFLHLFLERGNVFIDIGANTGIYTLRAAKYVGDVGVVLALEPYPEMLVEISHNVDINGFTSVRLRGLCAAAKTGVDVFWRNFEKPNSFSLLKRDDKALHLSVLKVRLDDLFAWEELNSCNYIKIDAEGAESEIIEGAMRTIEKYRPVIQVEVSISDFNINLYNYSVFQAVDKSGCLSPNKLLIPKESPKFHIAKDLGLILVD